MTIDINNFISLKGNINQGVKEALRDLNKNFIVTMIDSDELKPSEDNFYKPRDIDKMKESIEAFGIQQNLIVMKKDDTYEILAGERRYRGNKMLLDEGKEEFRLLPCRILPKISDTLKNIIIILTNSEARVKSQWEITEEVARLKILYENYKKENPNFKGRVREATAQDLDMSPAQVGRHEKIHKDLIEGLKEEYKDENINFTVAQAAATLPEEKQEEALQKYQDTGTLTTADINNLKEKPENLDKLEQEGQTTIPDCKPVPTTESGVYKQEFIKRIDIELPDQFGELMILVANDPNDNKYRVGYTYTTPKAETEELILTVNNRPYQTEQQAIESMFDKLHTIGSEELKQALSAANYTKEKSKSETRNIQMIIPDTDNEKLASKLLINLLKKELSKAIQDKQKSADCEEKTTISAYMEKLKRHIEIEQGAG